MGGGWYQAPADGHPPPGDAEAGDGAEVNNYLPPVRGRPALAPGGDVGSLAFARWGLQRCPQPSEPLLTCLGRPFCAPTPPSRSGPRTGPGDSPGHSPQPLQMFRRFPPLPSPRQSKVEGYVFFKPPPAKTPALRSGLINPEQPYNFIIPATGGWKVRGSDPPMPPDDGAFSASTVRLPHSARRPPREPGGAEAAGARKRLTAAGSSPSPHLDRSNESPMPFPGTTARRADRLPVPCRAG